MKSAMASIAWGADIGVVYVFVMEKAVLFTLAELVFGNGSCANESDEVRSAAAKHKRIQIPRVNPQGESPG